MSRVLRLGPAPRLKIQLCVALQFVEDYRPLQIFAQAGSLRVDRLAPGHAILFVDKLGHRNLRKVRISQELGAVEKRPSEGFGNEMNGRRRAVSDRRSTRLNSSHLVISYAVFCLKKKKKTITPR